MDSKTISKVMRHLRAKPSEARAEASRVNGRKGGRPSSNFDSTFHRDGTVTYWSVYEQVWRRTSEIPDSELAAMSIAEREQVERHIAKAR